MSQRVAWLVMLFVAAAPPLAGGEPGHPADPAGEPAFEFAFTDINPRSATHGQRVALSDLYAPRGLALQFMASWCEPCRDELPHLQELYAEAQAPIALIAADEGADHDGSLLIVAERAGLTMPLLFVPQAAVEEVESHYRYEIIPSTYVISKQGTIEALHEGAMSKQRMAELLERTLGGGPAPRGPQ